MSLPPVFLVYWRSEPNCSWCHAAMNLLTSRNIPYKAIDIAGPERDAALENLQKAGWRTIPAIFELTPDGEIKGFTEGQGFIGGFDKLVKDLENRI